MLKRLLRPQHRRRAPDESGLALNLSFVLHERSDSPAVRSAVRAVQQHARIVDRIGVSLSTPATSTEYEVAGVTNWLTATIGLPHMLANALNTPHDSVFVADAEGSTLQLVAFFRAPGMLTLPDAGQRRVGVAALLLRPDRRTSQLIVTGVHDWPEDQDGALRSLERLIQAHAGQWMPSRALWSAPAESLLPDEVY